MYTVIFITCSGKAEASRIGKALLVKKLAACANIIDRVDSLFWWKGRIDRAKECLLIVKSTREKFAGIAAAVRSLHSYETPEIIALPVCRGSKTYLEWIDDSIG